MGSAEIWQLMRQLEQVFDIVRLVDVSITTQMTTDIDGGIAAEPYHCYAVWKKSRRCENCVSAKAAACKGTRSKFEFVDNTVYYIISKYVEVDGVPYTLEMVSRLTDETLLGAYGKSRFIEAINTYNERMYFDSLTGIYNRRYYDEQLKHLPGEKAVVIMDVDNFKRINDTWGHLAGDAALRAVADAVRQYVRETDAVIRYGGDEFLLLMRDIPQEAFPERLEEIRGAIRGIVLEEYPGMRLSVSIGGVLCQGPVMEAFERADELLYQAKRSKDTMVLGE